MKVLFLTNIPSPYRVTFFNELGKLCDLTVLFEKSKADERDASWQKYHFVHFKGIIMQGKKARDDAAFCPEVTRYLKDKSYDVIICSNFSTPTGMWAIQYMKMHRIRYWIESDGGFAGSGRGIKERIKKHFIKGAVGYFSTADEHDRYYLTYGAKKERLVRYPFSSLNDTDILDAPASAEEKRALREELGMSEERVVLAIGRFIPWKRFDDLIRAAVKLPRDIGFYFVGGEPTEEYLTLVKELGLSNVHFVGFKLKEELKKYYRASDLFVLPSKGEAWGLVINEAMACGVPVIATDRCVGGLELIRDGENGYLTPVGDIDALADKIALCFDPATDLVKMGEEALRAIRPYTIEQMAKRHIEILEKKS